MMADNFTDMFGPGVGVQKVHLTKNGQVSRLLVDDWHSLIQRGLDKQDGLGKEGGVDKEGLARRKGLACTALTEVQEKCRGWNRAIPSAHFPRSACTLVPVQCTFGEALANAYLVLNTCLPYPQL